VETVRLPNINEHPDVVDARERLQAATQAVADARKGYDEALAAQRDSEQGRSGPEERRRWSVARRAAETAELELADAESAQREARGALEAAVESVRAEHRPAFLKAQRAAIERLDEAAEGVLEAGRELREIEAAGVAFFGRGGVREAGAVRWTSPDGPIAAWRRALVRDGVLPDTE